MNKIVISFLIWLLFCGLLNAGDSASMGQKESILLQISEFNTYVKSIEGNIKGRIAPMISSAVIDSIKYSLVRADSIWSGIRLDSIKLNLPEISEYQIGMLRYRYALEFEAIEALKNALDSDDRQAVIYAANQLKCELNRIIDLLEGRQGASFKVRPRKESDSSGL